MSSPLLAEFLNLVKIDSPSGNERALADYIKEKLISLGWEVWEDGAAAATGGNAGNIIARLPGRGEGKNPVLLFSAHLDTVISSAGVKPVVAEGVVRSDGRTILGADDKAGVAVLLEVARRLREEDVRHGGIVFLFTVGEEAGLLGSRFLKPGNIKADMGFVLDSGGPPGTIINAAPREDLWRVKIYGRSAHAGVNPEEGINAIRVAAEFVRLLPPARVDGDTTFNPGVIRGGQATNIVPDLVEIAGDMRSHREEKLRELAEEVSLLLQQTCVRCGGEGEIEVETLYPSYHLSPEAPPVKLAKAAAERVGLKAEVKRRGGGSDANVLNALGIPTVNLGIGLEKDHTPEEYVRIKDLENCSFWIMEIISYSCQPGF